MVLPGADAPTSRVDLHTDEHTTIWFTDPTYGYAQGEPNIQLVSIIHVTNADPRPRASTGYKPKPLLPNQVYVFHPFSGTVRCVATDFDM